MKRTPLRRKTPLRKKSDKQRAFEIEWATIRLKALQRDGYRCLRCKFPAIMVHHIRTRGAAPGLKLALSNLASVCSRCHQWAHDHPAEARALFRLKLRN